MQFYKSTDRRTEHDRFLEDNNLKPLNKFQLSGMDLRSDTGSYSDDLDRPDSALEKGPEFIFRKLLRQASSLVEVCKRQ